MTPDSKQASFSEIFFVCVLGIVWFLLNTVDSWFFQMNTNYLRKVLATDPIAVCIEEGNPEIFDRTIENSKVVKTLKTFPKNGSIWDRTIRDDLLEASFRNNRLLPKYVVQHVESTEDNEYTSHVGHTYNEYIYALIIGDDANLTKANRWLHEHQILVGTVEYEGFHPGEYLGHLPAHEHDIDENSFTNRELQDGVEIGKGPDVQPNDGSQVVILVWYKYRGTIYCVIGGGDSNSVMMEDVSSSPNIATEYNYFPSALLGENP
jgi:hypothetical protein